MDGQERHGLAHAAETWRELATPREQVALIQACDVAVRASVVRSQPMRSAMVLMVSGLLADAGVSASGADLMVRAAMHEARQRAGVL